MRSPTKAHPLIQPLISLDTAARPGSSFFYLRHMIASNLTLHCPSWLLSWCHGKLGSQTTVVYLVVDEDSTFASQQGPAVAHELGHQWLVTSWRWKWWDDLGLMSFANMMNTSGIHRAGLEYLKTSKQVVFQLRLNAMRRWCLRPVRVVKSNTQIPIPSLTWLLFVPRKPFWCTCFAVGSRCGFTKACMLTLSTTWKHIRPMNALGQASVDVAAMDSLSNLVIHLKMMFTFPAKTIFYRWARDKNCLRLEALNSNWGLPDTLKLKKYRNPWLCCLLKEGAFAQHRKYKFTIQLPRRLVRCPCWPVSLITSVQNYKSSKNVVHYEGNAFYALAPSPDKLSMKSLPAASCFSSNFCLYYR